MMHIAQFVQSAVFRMLIDPVGLERKVVPFSDPQLRKQWEGALCTITMNLIKSARWLQTDFFGGLVGCFSQLYFQYRASCRFVLADSFVIRSRFGKGQDSPVNCIFGSHLFVVSQTHTKTFLVHTRAHFPRFMLISGSLNTFLSIIRLYRIKKITSPGFLLSLLNALG